MLHHWTLYILLVGLVCVGSSFIPLPILLKQVDLYSSQLFWIQLSCTRSPYRGHSYICFYLCISVSVCVWSTDQTKTDTHLKFGANTTHENIWKQFFFEKVTLVAPNLEMAELNEDYKHWFPWKIVVTMRISKYSIVDRRRLFKFIKWQHFIHLLALDK